MLCPSGADPERNRHRNGAGWNLRSVAVILAIARYTGRQVWSRQRGRPGGGRSTVAAEMAVSNALSHVALVSEADFAAVQRFRARRVCKDGATRSYMLAGLVHCRLCGRRMDSHWVNDRAGYRCRHGYNSSRTRPPDAPRNLSVREELLLFRLVRQLPPDWGRSDADVELDAVAEVIAHLRSATRRSARPPRSRRRCSRSCPHSCPSMRSRMRGGRCGSIGELPHLSAGVVPGHVRPGEDVRHRRAATPIARVPRPAGAPGPACRARSPPSRSDPKRRRDVTQQRRSHRQLIANAAHGSAHRRWWAAARAVSDRTCSQNSSRPPGRGTRTISASAAAGSGTVHTTIVDTTVSTEPSATRSRSALASCTSARRVDRATRRRSLAASTDPARLA